MSSLNRNNELAHGPGPKRKTEIRRTAMKSKPARYTGPDDATKLVMLERDGYRCVRCGIHNDQQPLDPQHRVPRQMGGDPRPESNHISNLISLCRFCHDWVERVNRQRGYDLGYLVHRGTDPADVRVWHWRLGWVLPVWWDNGQASWEYAPPGPEEERRG